MPSPDISQDRDIATPGGAKAIVATALGISRREVSRCARTRPRSRNLVWKCQVSHLKSPVYLKIQGSPFPSDTVRHEARVLSLLGAQGLPSIPQVLACGQLVGNGLGFSILSGLPGNQLRSHLRSPSLGINPLQEALDWLDVLNALETSTLADILPQRLTTRFLPTFDPQAAGLAVCDKLDNSSDVRFARDCLHFAAGFEPANTDPCLIHGSYTVFNILAEHNSLCGVVDF
jgi:aminoglycoside phosphotransferase